MKSDKKTVMGVIRSDEKGRHMDNVFTYAYDASFIQQSVLHLLFIRGDDV